MIRPPIVRLQLIFLALAAGLVMWRMAAGPGRPDGLVVLSDIESPGLRHQAFVLEHPATLAVAATGSFEQAASDGRSAPLAAYAWIFRREDREVVWQMTPENVQRGRGTLAHAEDVLHLEPGTYDAYFTAFGNRVNEEWNSSFFRRITDPARHWQNDARKWMLALRSTTGDLVHLRHVNRERDRNLLEPGVLWTTGPVRNRNTEETLLDVQRTAVLDVYASGQFHGRGDDFAWIEDVRSGERVWQMTMENTQHAGGASVNRIYRGEIRLRPGVYRAVYEAGRSHAYQGWQANPPFDPSGWGLTLLYENPADSVRARRFDPWQSRSALAGLTSIPSDRRAMVQFEVDRSLPVYVYAMGELVDGHPYDWGWIEDASGDRVWEMKEERARHAGGASKNRIETSFLTLDPGAYTLFYETDDSHAYDDWNDDAPEHAERWGVTLFPVASLQPGTVEILSRRVIGKGEGEGIPEAPPEPPLPLRMVLPEGGYRLDWTRLRNESQREIMLELPDRATFRINALGEITPGERMDYGWIESVRTGERIWEMTWDNTRFAGGDDRNRFFEGDVTLPPGQYRVHFETDMSHAFDDFRRQSAPRNRDAWGLSMRRID